MANHPPLEADKKLNTMPYKNKIMANIFQNLPLTANAITKEITPNKTPKLPKIIGDSKTPVERGIL
jgi:hypothetical protein